MDSPKPRRIECDKCGAMLERVAEVPVSERNPRMEIYQCKAEGCIPTKIALIFEPERALSAEQKTFVERELARHGAFFPHDYTGSRR